MMWPAAKAGTLYFAAVFAAGFVLGAFRIFALAPVVGPVRATLIELPIMLVISWIVCRSIVRYLTVEEPRPRVVMGGLAFVLLIVAETALGTFGLGRSASEHMAVLMAPEGMLGLIGQVMVALFPLLQPERAESAGI
jgi:hypothetical protein